MEDHEELTTSCANSEPSLHNAPINPAENIGNNHGVTLTEGENSLDVLTFSTNHAMMEQILVKSSLDLSLSHNDLLDVLCDKDDLHDDIPMPPMMNDNAICALKSNTYAENKYVIHNASDIDELQLLSSLNTLGYIEFDDLCNLNYLEKKLYAYAELPWWFRHTYHAIGKYDNNGKYLIHRVYICTNLNFSFVIQDCNQLNGSNTNIHIHTIPMLPFVNTNLLQDRVVKNFIVQDHVHSDQGACKISFEYNRCQGRLPFQEGEDDEDITCMHTAILGDWHEDEGDQHGSPS